MGGYIGYIIGAIIILPLILVAYNYFFINKNDANSILKPYINNSTEVILNVPYFVKSNIPNDAPVTSKTFTISMATKNMGRDGSKETTLRYRLIYDDLNNKYYQVTMFDLYNDFWKELDNNKVYGKINKEDLANPKLGTKENPILVFSVRGINNPLIEKNMNGILTNYDTTLEQYKYNIYMYYTYVMSKEEFKERFEKGK